MAVVQNVHRDFVLGVLSEEELGQQIHIHELYREYVACVQTLRAFDAVSRDILQVCDCAVTQEIFHRDEWLLMCTTCARCSSVPCSTVTHAHFCTSFLSTGTGHAYNLMCTRQIVLRDCLLQRWTFPFVPDTNLLPLSGTQGVSSYRMSMSRLKVTYK